MRQFFLPIFLLSLVASNAQKLKKEDKQTITFLQKHVQVLASDSLEGRRTGTAGEQKAAQYISNEFKSIGLLPKGTNGFFQPFDIDEGKQINEATLLVIDGKSLQLRKDFFPLAFSPNTNIEALPSMAIQEVGMPWFLDLKEMLESNAQNPHFDLANAIKTKAKEAGKKGATALFIYNTSTKKDDVDFYSKDRSESTPVPVVYLTKEAVQKYFADPEATLDLKLKVDIGGKKRTGTNVVGYIDNKAANTIVIGAHYDHLGFGEDGNSLDRSSKQIHNGADDNASGVSAVIELARLLKASDLKQNNYLFITFSGEELGLFGSKYFVEHPTVTLGTINYMINLDMIGRMNDATPTLTVGGFGTSPSWASAYELSGKKGLYKTSLQFRFDSSGTGPSDHTSFYLKGVPVLFYFTGLHSDYHKPSDDAEKINYNGQLNVVKHIYSVIESQNKAPKLAFVKTRESQTATTAQFSVGLGILPDYTFSGAGVRVDGVSENKPAQKAGLRQGDVIVQLGEYNVSSMENYMQALSKFKKGDKTVVHYQRGSDKVSAAVEF